MRYKSQTQTKFCNRLCTLYERGVDQDHHNLSWRSVVFNVKTTSTLLHTIFDVETTPVQLVVTWRGRLWPRWRTCWPRPRSAPPRGPRPPPRRGWRGSRPPAASRPAPPPPRSPAPAVCGPMAGGCYDHVTALLQSRLTWGWRCRGRAAGRGWRSPRGSAAAARGRPRWGPWRRWGTGTGWSARSGHNEGYCYLQLTLNKQPADLVKYIFILLWRFCLWKWKGFAPGVLARDLSALAPQPHAGVHCLCPPRLCPVLPPLHQISALGILRQHCLCYVSTRPATALPHHRKLAFIVRSRNAGPQRGAGAAYFITA